MIILNILKKVIYDEKITEQFDYDAAGNRIKRTLEGREEKYYYNNKNQLLQIENKNDTILYKYDIYNRTRQVVTENGTVIKNKYDPLGLRYQKEVNGEVHKYIFDGWSIVAETDKEGELKSREVRGYELLKKETNNKQYYYHQNEHGDIIYLSNVDEEIENSYSYDVFGNIAKQQENIENVFKYAGEQQDPETEQYYLRARFYNPIVGRFTQEDIYRNDGLNLYVYVVNNPLLWIDPSGYAKCNRVPEEITENRQREVDRYKVTDENGNVIASNPYNWDAKVLQQHMDAIHAAQYKPRERIEKAPDGTTTIKYAYGEYGGKEPMAITITKEGKVILSSNQENIKEKAIQKAYELFGEENVDVVQGRGQRYKPTREQRKAVKEELAKKQSEYRQNNNLGETDALPGRMEKKFDFGTGHAEVKGIQRAKERNQVKDAKQFCSHLSCLGCEKVQNMEGVLNGTGISRENNYVFSRDYTHI